jgi:hypothetical protein
MKNNIRQSSYVKSQSCETAGFGAGAVHEAGAGRWYGFGTSELDPVIRGVRAQTARTARN